MSLESQNFRARILENFYLWVRFDDVERRVCISYSILPEKRKAMNSFFKMLVLKSPKSFKIIEPVDWPHWIFHIQNFDKLERSLGHHYLVPDLKVTSMISWMTLEYSLGNRKYSKNSVLIQMVEWIYGAVAYEIKTYSWMLLIMQLPGLAARTASSHQFAPEEKWVS